VGESDQKYWNLIPLLAELMPRSKFIWLIRDGRDAVASMCAWGWYHADAVPQAQAPSDLNQRWLYYRENGWQCGSVSQKTWEQMPILEKTCWYWNHVNSKVEKQLHLLPSERWTVVKLEHLEQEIPRLFDFLRVRQAGFCVPVSNKALRPVRKWEAWERAERQVFDRWCGRNMDRWYPGWAD